MEEELRNYGKIGMGRLLDIKVIVEDETVVYEGMIEHAPQSVKDLNYSKIEGNNPMVYYVYNQFN